MKLNGKKKIVAAVAAASLVIGVGGAAFAYFTSTGNGSGTGTVGTATNWTVNGVRLSGRCTPMSMPPLARTRVW
jgi:hypothetical protein